MKDDYDQFYKKKVTPLAYKRKIDKMIQCTISWLLCIVCHLLLKKKINSDTKLERVEKVGNLWRKLNKLSVSFALMTAVDIIFYCGHQLVHQRPSSLFTNWGYFFSYLWSVVTFSYTVYVIVSFIFKMSEIDLDIADKVKDLSIELDSSCSELTPSRDMSTLDDYKLNTSQTVAQIEKDDFIISFIKSGINDTALGQIYNFFNALAILKILIASLIILSFQPSPGLQLSLFCANEFVFLLVITVAQIKYSVHKSKMVLIVTYMESLTLLFYGLANLFDYHGRYSHTFGTFVLVIFVTTMFVEYVRLFVVLFQGVKSLITRKKKKENTVSPAEKKKSMARRKEEVSYWTKHEFVRLRRVRVKWEKVDVEEIEGDGLGVLGDNKLSIKKKKKGKSLGKFEKRNNNKKRRGKKIGKNRVRDKDTGLSAEEARKARKKTKFSGKIKKNLDKLVYF
jgi:hypothetical protein